MDDTCEKSCFRCGREIDKYYKDGGQITWSGFVNGNKYAYYNQLTLCEVCHEKLLDTITHFIMAKPEHGKEN